MKVNIISIGNSKGVRIPKILLEESGIEDEVEIKVKKGEIRLIPIKKKPISIDSVTLASEAVLAKDWLKPEEDKAWQDL